MARRSLPSSFSQPQGVTKSEPKTAQPQAQTEDREYILLTGVDPYDFSHEKTFDDVGEAVAFIRRVFPRDDAWCDLNRALMDCSYPDLPAADPDQWDQLAAELVVRGHIRIVNRIGLQLKGGRWSGSDSPGDEDDEPGDDIIKETLAITLSHAVAPPGNLDPDVAIQDPPQMEIEATVQDPPEAEFDGDISDPGAVEFDAEMEDAAA